ncbi:THAP domain-containing 1-like [Paramuricea clavata]|uniref:THAP domain-containing 1-like n=1 Tax=Paramuricea clavata TaxID=317549 RepID=A0A7D9DG05_PARCT|nr:THAP domain-containing 1-like [Paramuricea clavata]
MPSRCVVFGCSNTCDPKNGVILHKIPYDGDSRPEAIKRRKRWVDFVKRKRAKWEPSSTSCICSRHFELDAFVRKVNLPGQETTYILWLKKMKSVFHRFQHFRLQMKATKIIQHQREQQERLDARLRKNNMQQPQKSNKHLCHLHQLSWEK